MTNTENNIKKFEGFLDKMRGLLDSARKQGHIIVRVEDLENAFPELAESEDERIKETLIKFHKSTIDIDGIKGNEIVDWLEKQGEQNDSDVKDYNSIDLHFGKSKEKKELKEIEDEEYNGEDYGIDSLWHAHRILEKTLGKVGGYQTDDGILAHKCAITAVKKLYEKKSAWSEEDEHRFKDTIYFLDTAKKHYASTVELDACIDWLKSLKDRVQPQSQPAWSEKDEKIWKELIEEVKDQLDSVPAPDCRDKEHEKVLKQLNKWLSWLKSLKYRYNWKPSEEHVHWLKWAINRLPDTEKANEAEAILEDLLKQLKEL